MGTMLQRYKFSEEDFRGERFKDFHKSVKGNNDLLSLTQPQAIAEIHSKYFEAGADIVETNTFSSTTIAMADYDMQDLVYELNYESAKIAKKVADEFTAKEPHKPRFVAGAIGPTNKTASMSPDVNDPGFRAISFEELRVAYKQQAEALIDGGVDILAGTGPLGFAQPRLCVQVKSQQSPADVTVFRSLQGSMQTFGAEQGLLVCWGGFNKAVQSESRLSYFRIRLWDAGALLEAVLRMYSKLPKELQTELPLKRVWALVLEE